MDWLVQRGSNILLMIRNMYAISMYRTHFALWFRIVRRTTDPSFPNELEWKACPSAAGACGDSSLQTEACVGKLFAPTLLRSVPKFFPCAPK